MTTFEAESPDLSIVWQWFEFQGLLIASERRRFRLVHEGRFLSDWLDPVLRNRLVDMSQAEIEEVFEEQRRELELVTMFELLATAEAIIRINFARRSAAKPKLKDNLSRKFRAIRGKRRDRVRLDEDILEAAKEELSPPSIVSEFRGALRLRHWLAHGRHWNPKLGRSYSPADVFDIANALVEALAV